MQMILYIDFTYKFWNTYWNKQRLNLQNRNLTDKDLQNEPYFWITLIIMVILQMVGEMV